MGYGWIRGTVNHLRNEAEDIKDLRWLGWLAGLQKDLAQDSERGPTDSPTEWAGWAAWLGWLAYGRGPISVAEAQYS